MYLSEWPSATFHSKLNTGRLEVQWDGLISRSWDDQYIRVLFLCLSGIFLRDDVSRDSISWTFA